MTVRKLCTTSERGEVSTALTVLRLIQKFEPTGSIEIQKSPNRNRTIRTQANIAIVLESMTESHRIISPPFSKNWVCQCLHFNKYSKKNLHIHPYKI